MTIAFAANHVAEPIGLSLTTRRGVHLDNRHAFNVAIADEINLTPSGQSYPSLSGTQDRSSPITEQAISPSRRRMIEDMTIRSPDIVRANSSASLTGS
jgi:hypothetical protein